MNGTGFATAPEIRRAGAGADRQDRTRGRETRHVAPIDAGRMDGRYFMSAAISPT